ncbi:hypothetical protein [Nocardioides sp.]|uniref:hypothetical protein n=1 Tax=Nocardioides sp. TaxID=35761 RepID=UPI002D8110AA|nr:hypothetical protein [Nocardioides sp.]HET8959594.1 hypothetical protein [Nocardioides sp.]
MPDRVLPDGEKHPVAAGLLALVGVGLVVGLIVGLAALAGTRMLGLDGEDASAQSTSQESLYLPRPEKTTGPSGPLITLAPGATESPSEQPSKKPAAKPSKKPEKEISLSASQSSVAPMEQIDLTGVYPGGEGAILQVQRFEGGSWQAFPVTVSVSDETFATYVQTSQGGVNRFRVADTDSGLVSNDVRVTIG